MDPPSVAARVACVAPPREPRTRAQQRIRPYARAIAASTARPTDVYAARLGKALQTASPAPGARGQRERRSLMIVYASADPCIPMPAEGGQGADASVNAEQGEEELTVLGVTMNTKDAAMWQGRMYLVLTAAAYGTIGVFFKFLFMTPEPPVASALTLFRSVVITACFVPTLAQLYWQRAGISKVDAKRFWMAAFVLALANAGTIGLLNTGLQTSVAMTPLLQLVLGDRIRPSMWAAVALCLTGVMVLTVSPGEAAVGLSSLAVSLGYGDWLCIGGAFSFAVYLIAMEKYANAGVPSVPLQAVKNVLLALMYLGWCTVDVLVNQLHSGMSAVASVVALWPGWNNPMLWAMTAVSAVVSGALADFWQARGQDTVSAGEANIILSLDPLFCVCFATVFLHEMLTPNIIIGGAIVIGASLVPAVFCGDDEPHTIMPGHAQEHT